MDSRKPRHDSIDLSDIPTLSILSAFERAATHSSFAKAALNLGRTRSAISHAISELEEKFGCSLFERIGRTVKLTQAGEEYLREVREALRTLDNAGKNITGKLQTQVIKIYTEPLVARDLIIPNLADFKKNYPDLKLDIDLGRSPADWSMRDIDIEIRIGDTEDSRLQSYDIGRIGFIPACSPDLMQGDNGLKCIADLERFTVIRDTLQPELWEKWLEVVGYSNLKLTNDLDFRDMQAITAAMIGGIGLGFASYPFILDSTCYGSKLILPFPNAEKVYFPYKFICRRDKRNEGRIVAFKDWLADAFSNLRLKEVA